MLKKVVDGREVALSAEEEARVRAEWGAEDARPKPARPADRFDRLLTLLVAKGALKQEEADALK